ncbi:MAG: hypothetical protein GX633_01050 [Clostridiales bacterium]|nr:hypothetical protein [Clostridiales bacterium]
MAVTISEARYRNFGKCVKIENAFAEVWVTVDIGPRIIRYSLKGGENFMYEDKNRRTKQDIKPMQDYYGKGACWYIYGGHRIWASPEYMPETYYPDNNKVKYEIDGRTVTFIPQPQVKNNIQITLKVTLEEYSAKVKVENSITNLGDAPKVLSVWALSVLAPGGIEIVPMNNHDTGFVNNKKMAIWNYTDLSDKRVAWAKEYMMLKQDKHRENPFKIGIDNRRAWAAYILRGVMFLKEFEYIEAAQYPDEGMNFETYTCDKFLEMETLSPLTKIEKNQTITHCESWDIIDDVKTPKLGDFAAVEEIVRQYIGI